MKTKIEIQTVSTITLEAIKGLSDMIHAYVSTQPQNESLEAQNVKTLCQVVRDCIDKDLSG